MLGHSQVHHLLGTKRRSNEIGCIRISEVKENLRIYGAYNLHLTNRYVDDNCTTGLTSLPEIVTSHSPEKPPLLLRDRKLKDKTHVLKQ